MRVLGERLNGIQEVKSSILSVSTKKIPSPKTWYFFIQADRLGISSPQGVYHQHGKAVLHLITPSGVYLCRLDDIQFLTELMI